jgi:hypothetical protein
MTDFEIVMNDFRPHRWDSHSLRDHGKMFQCAGCKAFVFLLTGETDLPHGWCGVPELGNQWKVGDKVGTVIMIDWVHGSFRLMAMDGPRRVQLTFNFGEGKLA